MLILAVDTSGRNGSVALCRGDANSLEVLQLSGLEGGPYSSRLVPAISDLLLRSNVGKPQLDGIAVVDGPGSFTGLRVGLSTVKALCEVLRKPLAAVSMLEALADTIGRNGERVMAILDAGRGELYLGEFQIERVNARLVAECIKKRDEFLAHVPSAPLRFVTPVSMIAEALATTGSEVTLVSALQADAIGRIGIRKLLAGDDADPATLDANYIRRSDAELYALRER
jgi:tRNA threonylcarbamoyladenosine biosynthesis protein TsaB